MWLHLHVHHSAWYLLVLSNLDGTREDTWNGPYPEGAIGGELLKVFGFIYCYYF